MPDPPPDEAQDESCARGEPRPQVLNPQSLWPGSPRMRPGLTFAPLPVHPTPTRSRRSRRPKRSAFGPQARTGPARCIAVRMCKCRKMFNKILSAGAPENATEGPKRYHNTTLRCKRSQGQFLEIACQKLVECGQATCGPKSLQQKESLKRVGANSKSLRRGQCN